MFEALVLALVVFWFLDLWQTLRMTKIFGNRIEENPFARFLLKHSRLDFAIFKVVDLGFVVAIMYFLNYKNIELAGALLSVFVLLYVVTVAHNFKVYRSLMRA